jgi:uncharacterized protein YbaP (TraB family)
MKKIAVLFFAAFTCLASVFPQSAVWKVTKDGNTLYLGGSVHILREEDYPLPEEFDLAYQSSSLLVLEADADQINDSTVLGKIILKMLLPGTDTLKTVLREDTYNRLKAKCEELAMPIERLLKMRPSIVALMLSMAQIQRLGFSVQGVDHHYYSRAKQEAREVRFLESVEAQFDMLAGIAPEHQSEFVDYSLADMDKTEDAMLEIVAQWRNGERETEGLAEMKEKFPSAYQAMLVDRNLAWLPRIEDYLASEPVEFVLVGLAHLQGDDGLLFYLERRGCAVEQLAAGN